MNMVNKLVLAMINDEDAFHVMDKLNAQGFGVTKLASTGGFLRTGSTTLLCGVNEDQIPALIEVIEKTCKSRKQITSVSAMNVNANESFAPYPVEVTVGGATICVLNIEEFRKV